MSVGVENVPGIPGACATSSFAYLVRGPWPVACRTQRHYLNQWFVVVNWNPGRKFQWIFIQSEFSYKKSSLKNVVWKMADMLSWPQCVKGADGAWFPISVGATSLELWYLYYCIRTKKYSVNTVNQKWNTRNEIGMCQNKTKYDKARNLVIILGNIGYTLHLLHMWRWGMFLTVLI